MDTFDPRRLITDNGTLAHKGVLHYALIYVDIDGQIHQATSPSIAGFENSIFTPRATKAFAEAVKPQLQETSPFAYSADLTVGEKISDPRGELHRVLQTSLISTHGPLGQDFAQRQLERYEHVYIPDQLAAKQLTAVSATNCQPQNDLLLDNGLRFGNRDVHSSKNTTWFYDERRFYLCYKSAFERFNQLNCRILAKAFIKLVEPRKQIKYPYNGRVYASGGLQELSPEMTRPPWWPVGVKHREPDHLLKAQRIQLLIFLVRGLLVSHGISTSKLRSADRTIRHQISPKDRLLILDEVYRIREAEVMALENAAVSHIRGLYCPLRRDVSVQPIDFTGLNFSEEAQSDDMGIKGVNWFQEKANTANLIPKERPLKRKHHHMENTTSLARN